jgi:hypothetical protein
MLTGIQLDLLEEIGDSETFIPAKRRLGRTLWSLVDRKLITIRPGGSREPGCYASRISGGDYDRNQNG